MKEVLDNQQNEQTALQHKHLMKDLYPEHNKAQETQQENKQFS